jgi:CHAD domain-containing protein
VTKGPTLDEAVRQRLLMAAADLRENVDRAIGGDAEAVHATRIACRRSRALLPVLANWVPDGDLDLVTGELTWLRRSLGDTRDVEVIIRRLEEGGGVPPAVAQSLQLAGSAARVDRPRAHRLVSALEQLAERSVGPAGQHGARRVMVDEHRTLKKRVTRARKHPDDRAWHAIRRTAKKVRYLAEAIEGADGKGARRLRKRATKLATSLGERQDAVVTRAVLAPYADDPEVAEQLKRQETAIDELDVEFPELWTRFEGAWHRI